MRAVEVRALSPDFSGVHLADLPEPRPAKGEVVLRLAAAGVNFPDLLMARGGYQLQPPLPYVAGMEMAGEVLAVGEGVDAQLGEARVAGLRFGAFAEQVCVPFAQTRPIIGDMTLAQSASAGTGLLTAYVGLVCRGALCEGETVLVLGAAGGMGLAAAQLARHLGARVVATASSEEKRAELTALGFADVLAPSAELGTQVKALTDGRGADVIYDPVGGEAFAWAERAIAWGGRYLVIGFAAGQIPTLRINRPLIKGYALVGVRAGEYGRRDPAAGAANLAAVDKLLEHKELRPHVSATLPLAEWRDAFALLDERRAVGKICLV